MVVGESGVVAVMETELKFSIRFYNNLIRYIIYIVQCTYLKHKRFGKIKYKKKLN